MNIIVLEVAHVARAIPPLKYAQAILLAVLEHPVEDCSVGPVLTAVPILLVLFPQTVVFQDRSSLECSETLGLVVYPRPVVHVAILVYQSTQTIGLIGLPLPLILAAIFPYLGPVTLALTQGIPLA